MKHLSPISSGFLSVCIGVVVALSITVVAKEPRTLPDALQRAALAFHNGQSFSIPRNSNWKLRMDLEGFGLTNDGKALDTRVITAGNLERKILVKVDCDTLYSDLAKAASAYSSLWTDLGGLAQDSSLCCRREWTDSLGSWLVYTRVHGYGFEINEKQIHLFRVADGLWLHASAVRPMYLEGDSTIMFAALHSLQIISSSEADAPATGAAGKGATR